MPAFEAQAVDYLLKSLQAARLKNTVEKLVLALAKPAQTAINLEATLDQLRGLLASVGNTIRMVLTAEREYLIRTPLKELQEQLDITVFWQIHRAPSCAPIFSRPCESQSPSLRD